MGIVMVTWYPHACSKCVCILFKTAEFNSRAQMLDITETHFLRHATTSSTDSCRHSQLQNNASTALRSYIDRLHAPFQNGSFTYSTTVCAMVQTFKQYALSCSPGLCQHQNVLTALLETALNLLFASIHRRSFQVIPQNISS
jgi:hypothetical protein